MHASDGGVVARAGDPGTTAGPDRPTAEEPRAAGRSPDQGAGASGAATRASTAPPEANDVTRLRRRADAGDRRNVARQLERLRTRSPGRADVAYALGNLYAELNAWRPSVDAYAAALRLEPAYRADPRLINDVVEALASDLAHSRAATILRKEIGRAAVPRLEQAMRSASPRQRVRAKRVRAGLRR
jgi:hypothetical protein